MQGQFAGKFDWVSPEQMGDFGGNVDGRSDIYSLGLLITAAVARVEVLPMGASIFDAVGKALVDVPDLTGVDPTLVPMLSCMLNPDPAQRPDSMAAVIAMLDNPALIPTGLPDEPEDLQKTVVGQPLPLRPRPAPEPAARPDPGDGATQVVPKPARAAPQPRPAPPQPAPAPAASGGRGGLIAVGAAVLLAAAGGGAWVSGVFGPGTPEAPAVVASAPPAEPPPAAPAVSSETLAAQAAAEAKAAQEAAAARLEAETQAARAAAEAQAKAAEEAAAAQAAAEAKAAEDAAAQARAAEAAAAAQAAAEAAAREQAARDLLARQAAWIAARPPEPCLFIAPLAATGETALESLAAAAAPVDRLSADFSAEFGSPPRIVPTSIAPAQCAALDFAAALRSGDLAAQAPQITLSAPDGTVKGGETVRGVVEIGGETGAGAGSVALFSVGPTGAVTDLAEFLQPPADGRARFAFPTAWAEPPAADSAPVPLLLVAIATDRPVAAFDGLDDGYTAESVMPHLRYWLQEDGQPGGVGLRALTLTP